MPEEPEDEYREEELEEDGLEELEEEEATIQSIISAAAAYAPDYDAEKIYLAMDQTARKLAAAE